MLTTDVDGPILHERAMCESTNVGAGTRVWANAHVLPGAQIGADCNICDGVFIENNVIVGDGVTIKCGVQLWDGVRIEDNVFIGPNATFTNDRFPRSNEQLPTHPETIVREGSSIGANATILPGVEIGTRAMIGAGAVVTRSVPNNAIVVGNPARITGYVDAGRTTIDAAVDQTAADDDAARVTPSRVRGVSLHRQPVIRDLRGSLTATTFDTELPFEPKRHFLVFDVPGAEVRGEHAHHACHQFLVCVSGSVRVLADDGTNREEFVLDRNNVGVYLPPMTWGTQYGYAPGTVLLVFASHEYDADDYIRTYDEFLALAKPYTSQ